MLYTAYEARRVLSKPWLAAVGVQSAALSRLPRPLAETLSVRSMRAVCDTVLALEVTHRRPAFGIDAVEIAGEEVSVREDVVKSTPFGTLLHFEKAGDRVQPSVLVVPGLAGHYGTLVRDTVRTMLPDHDVYRRRLAQRPRCPASHGRFGLDEYIDAPDRLPGGDRPGRPSDGDLPALRSPCWRRPRSWPTTPHPAQPRQPDADGRARRRAGQPRVGQRVRAANLPSRPRAHRHPHGAAAAPRSRAPGLPGVPAGDGLHQHGTATARIGLRGAVP